VIVGVGIGHPSSDPFWSMPVVSGIAAYAAESSGVAPCHRGHHVSRRCRTQFGMAHGERLNAVDGRARSAPPADRWGSSLSRDMRICPQTATIFRCPRRHQGAHRGIADLQQLSVGADSGVHRRAVSRPGRAGGGRPTAGQPATVISPTLGRAATWRAARSGLEGDLVDVLRPASRPAADVLAEFIDGLRPQLQQSGDWSLISDLHRQVLAAGTSAARQRRAPRCRDRLTAVVRQLIAETAQR
jgi:hypothetical protein